MTLFSHDLRFALRIFFKNPGFTTVALLTLALGIGANTIIFSFVNAILLRPLPFPDADRLVAVEETNLNVNQGAGPASPRNLEDWARLSKTIEEFGAWRDWGFTLKGGEIAEGVYAGIASPSLFRTLRVKPVLGRIFFEEEDQPGRNQVVLLSYAYWQQRFGGDKNIVGRTLILSRMKDETFTVVGILPKDFDSPSLAGIKIWALLSTDPDQFLERSLRNRQVFARLGAGTSLKEARAEMNTIASQLAQQYPESNAGWGISIVPLLQHEVGSSRQALLVFWGAVGLVLLIACINVANLMLGWTADRQKEFAIRSALGASRRRLIRLILSQSVFLALIGGLIALLLALWISDVFVFLSPPSLPRLEQVGVDKTVFGFALFLSFATGLLLGLIPALQSSRIDLSESLKDGARSIIGTSRSRLRSLLLVGEISLVLMLLVGAGLLTQTFLRLQKSQLGFNTRNLLTFELFASLTHYPNRKRIASFYQQVLEELRAIPSVQAAGSASSGPLFGGREPITLRIEGRPSPQPGEAPVARFHNISPDYFRTMGIPILKGRDFAARDDDRAPAVALINETMARRYWPNEDPIGKHLILSESDPSIEIVGVVGDVQRLRLDSQVEPEIYWPFMQQARWASFFVVRTSSDPARILSTVRARVGNLDKDVLMGSVRTMDQRIEQSLLRPRFNMLLVGSFALTALILAASGIYGVVSYSVSQRTREIGIRMSLGAERRHIFRMIIQKVMGLTLLGVIIGLAGSLLLKRFLSSLLFEMGSTNFLALMIVTVVLTVVALMAGYVPARRATRVDPITALRYE